jgi:small subunit ribosomal protein S26e
MPKKRKSRGRAKGGKGRGDIIQCSMCGSLVPRDKAKKVTSWVSLLDPQLSRELRAKGAIIPRQRVIKYYCISCAVHHRVAKVRADEERKFIPRY